MTKVQKTISIPIAQYAKIEKLFSENAEELRVLEINNPSALFRVLANLGAPRLPEVLKYMKETRDRT